MSTISIYGIKNCDTMKKAFNWLDENNINYQFHDYKKVGADKTVIKHAIDEHGWENVINRRGTTWRKLSEEKKSSMDADTAIKTALENPSIIKRPLLVTKESVHLGFKAELHTGIFS